MEYQTHYDNMDKCPRLCAMGVKCGLSPAFLGQGVMAVSTDRQPFGIESSVVSSSNINDIHSTSNDKSADFQNIMPQSYLQDFDWKGKHFVFVPYAYHSPLSTSRDDSFVKFCRMKGVQYDAIGNNGTLFFHIDNIKSN